MNKIRMEMKINAYGVTAPRSECFTGVPGRDREGW